MNKKTEETAALLVEARCEELPPAILWKLADDFPDLLLEKLKKAGFADDASRREKNRDGKNKRLATPRRLIARLDDIHRQTKSRVIVRRGPQTAAGLDDGGDPTPALRGFLRANTATMADLHTAEEKGKTYFALRKTDGGRDLQNELAAIVESALFAISAPRLMRWGDNDFRFVRPLRGILMMHGKEIIGGAVLNVAAADGTLGHRVLSKGKIKFPTAEEYETVLREKGRVIVDIVERLKKIRQELVNAEIGEEGVALLDDEPDEVVSNMGVVFNERNRVRKESPLLCEVAAMCEYPTVYRRKIDEVFMDLPIWCVAECMKKHQRFFSFQDDNGKLLRDYFVAADNKPQQPEPMLRGYDSVLRARLHDVRFYYEEDKKIPLDDYVEKLKGIIYHKKLGNQYDRIGRVCRIAATIAPMVGVNCDVDEINRTARKILASLPTLMVREYPDLQEYMSRKYFGKNRLLNFVLRCYNLERLIGMFAAGEKPTGSKDPHGLRRDAQEFASSLLILGGELKQLPNITDAIDAAVESFGGKISDVRGEAHSFILDRIRFAFSPKAPYLIIFPVPSADIVESVLSKDSHDFRHLEKKLKAMVEFAKKPPLREPEAKTLIAANKRINNILRKSGLDSVHLSAVDESLFEHAAEKELHAAVARAETKSARQIQKGDFAVALKTLAAVAPAVDKFFDEVLVNAEDEKIRNNRAALLFRLRELLNQIADLSRLTAA